MSQVRCVGGILLIHPIKSMMDVHIREPVNTEPILLNI
jgi:hypothetical protein